jgi:uncharacterized protein (TIGR00369 family)
MKPVLHKLRRLLDGKLSPDEAADTRFNYPPPVSTRLGLKLVKIDEGMATIELETNLDHHANPMGTVHGGIIADLGDATIGTAHATTLEEGESLTTVDLKINYFRPVWKTLLTATAHPVQRGKTISYYECRITDEREKLIAIATSTVMTLRGEAASGR